MPSYKEQMRDREVYGNLMAMVSRTRKLAKAEMQEALNLLEKELKKVCVPTLVHPCSDAGGRSRAAPEKASRLKAETSIDFEK